MSETRQVTLHIDAVQQTVIKEAVGKDKFFDALGYLGTWNMTYPTVDIYPDDTDLVAVYKDDTGKTGYVIGAVWHEDHYGFHS
jgi:hypothetical protein